jgi:hypothetical protein
VDSQLNGALTATQDPSDKSMPIKQSTAIISMICFGREEEKGRRRKEEEEIVD